MKIKERIKNLFSKISETFFDILLPKPENLERLERMTIAELRNEIPEAICDGEEFEALFSYKNESARNIVWEIKYKKNKKLAKKLAPMLYDKIDKRKNLVLIPVPSSKRRLLEKGTNQTELICEEIIKIDDKKILNYENRLVLKTKHTKTQTSIKNKRMRLKNLKNCFSINNPEKIKDKSFIIIDDVITTGATIREIKKILEKAGAKEVHVLAIAH